MKNTFRRFISLVLVCIVILTFVGCDSTNYNNDYSNDNDEFIDDSQETEIFSDIGGEILQYPYSDGVLQYNVYETYTSIAMCDKNASGDIIIPEAIDDVPVKHISEKAFYQCSNITSVTIPSELVEIDRNAFLGCDNLTSVYISNISNWCNIYFENEYSNPIIKNDYPYNNHKRNLYLNNELVTDLVIPEGVTYISDYAFANCTSIKGVTFPDSVEQIGVSSFQSLPFLIEVNFGSGLTRIENYAFYLTSLTGDIYLPEGLNYIGEYAFSAFDGDYGIDWEPYILIDDTLYIVDDRDHVYVDEFLNKEITFEEFKDGIRPYNYVSYGREYIESWKEVFGEINKYEIINTGKPTVTIPQTVNFMEEDAFPSYSNYCLRCYKGSTAIQWVVSDGYENYEVIE